MIKIPTPQAPYLVSGQVFTSRGTVQNSIVRINSELVTTTNSSGQFLFDLANFADGYTADSSYTIEAWDEFDNEYKTDTITASGESQTKNMFLDDRDVTNKQTKNQETRNVGVTGVGNRPFTKENMLPVENSERQFTRKVSGAAYPKYIGEAAPGTPTSEARWRIKYVLSNGEITWASGNADFDKEFDERTSYSYS